MKIDNLQNISDEQMKILQSKYLEILLEFQNFCNKHNLSFFLIGGSCIGALRHKGFIPWDDDIDVMMLREDYERLHILWDKYGQKEKYSLCRTNVNENYHQSTSMFKLNNSTFVNQHSVNEDINHGMYIDVDVMDIRAKDKFKFFFQCVYACLYSLYNVQRLPDNKGKTLRYLSKILLNICPNSKIRYKIWNYCLKKMIALGDKDSGYVVELIAGPKSMMRKLPKEWFETTKIAKFEGYDMPIPAGAEKWMTMIFGNYMEYPPVEERVAKHKVTIIDTETSYKKYKGVYYCKEN